MAIDTTNKKLALMEWCSVWEPGLPISPSTLGQDDQQQLLWDYPGILWGAFVATFGGGYPGASFVSVHIISSGH